ncbi:acyl carrier protein [Kiloniella spongiae]|uniref:Acyl carrier protein n=1 Tax=Kiloniella spongiae TaxID=1489064 RepID=A0A0H2ME98_9PROT|nr:acyl carrier protein [Kiloniella spongiae]KLN58962.1 acyl carrier protein [Kiloniella spongiae]
MTIYEQLTEVFRDFFDDEHLVATPELSSNDIALWDSLNHIRLMIAVEAAFGVELKTEEITNLKNVGELANILENKTHS